MFDQIQKRLSDIFSNLSRKGKISEDNISDALRDVRRALLEADVNFKVAKNFIAKVHDKAIGQEVLNSVTPSQQFIKVIKEELTEFLGVTSANININKVGSNCNKASCIGNIGKNMVFEFDEMLKIRKFLRKISPTNQEFYVLRVELPNVTEQAFFENLGKITKHIK